MLQMMSYGHSPIEKALILTARTWLEAGVLEGCWSQSWL